MGREGREERGMGACTRWDFRKSAPMDSMTHDTVDAHLSWT